MTNKEYAAKLLIEAADLLAKSEVLDESYGAHGVYGKIAENRYKAEKAKNDAHDDALKHKKEQFERANYGDRVCGKPADRCNERDLKNIVDTDKKIRDGGRREYAEFRGERKAAAVAYSQNANNIGNVYDAGNRRMEQHERKSKKLHERINGRVKSQNETVEALLNECYDLLEESYGAHGVYGRVAEERGLDKIATKDKALRKAGAPYSKVNNSLKAEVHYSDEARDIANSINKRTNPEKYSKADSKINARAERKVQTESIYDMDIDDLKLE